MKLTGLKFWIKYSNEMEEIYENENDDIVPKHLDKHIVSENARVIGERAEDDVVYVLEQFSDVLINILEKNLSIRKTTQLRKMKEYWKVQHVLWDKSIDTGKDWKTMAGANIDLDENKFIVWFYKKGGQVASDLLKENLMSYFNVIDSGKDYGFSAGDIVLYTLNLDLLIQEIEKDSKFLEKINFFEELLVVPKEVLLKIVS